MTDDQSLADEKDFNAQMETLAVEAERQLGSAQAKPAAGSPEMLRPLVMGIEALGRAAAENGRRLDRLQETAAALGAALPAQFSGLRNELAGKGPLTQQLFDAMHEELRGYKDNFLMETLQKPIIRDLIMHYDDLMEMHRRLDLFVAANEQCTVCNQTTAPMNEFLGNFGRSLHHTASAILESLARLDVIRQEPSTGLLDKKKHRAVAVVSASSAEENNVIVQSLKPCFLWRERIIRPEEVVIKKWS